MANKEANATVYVARKGYELKTWINVSENDSNDEVISKAKAKFRELGVDIKQSDIFDWEWI